VFDYQGNPNNPPDIILKKVDAVEIKKLESLRTKIALNSSYPKSKLLPDNPTITKYCGEDWTEKDIIYTIGCVEKKQLKLLWLIYGNCYVAEKETYQRLKRTIANEITEIPRKAKNSGRSCSGEGSSLYGSPRSYASQSGKHKLFTNVS